MKVLFAGKDSDTVSHYNWVYFFSSVLLIGLCLSLVWTGAVLIYGGLHPEEIRGGGHRFCLCGDVAVGRFHKDGATWNFRGGFIRLYRMGAFFCSLLH